MNYDLIKSAIDLVEEFDISASSSYPKDINGFRQWVCDAKINSEAEPTWNGKEKGRSAESVINTLIVHMNRYAKSYSKSAIHESGFSTQEDFIYLINLKTFGSMTKTDLIKKNIHEKPVGMQIINRLIAKGWIQQSDSSHDKRSKIISITSEGAEALDRQMTKIRQATEIVTGDLTHAEKMHLIRLLQKLEDFHQPIFSENLDAAQLVDKAYQYYLSQHN